MNAGIFHLNPFPGIRSYEIGEEELFFGRENQVAELVSRLSRTRFLAIVGASGCGKSSLIRAGLIPELTVRRQAETGTSWELHIMKPGDDPVGNLAVAIGGSIQKSWEILPAIRKNPSSLATYLDHSGEKKHHLLFLDQFEELFRFRNRKSGDGASYEVELFIRMVLGLYKQQEIPVYVVLSMRTDFLDHCTEFRELSECINAGHYLVPRMNAAERRLAITGPVRYKGARIADDLVDRILSEIGDDPDQLPIMQHALMRTWNYWTLNRIGDQPVSMDHYESVGTLSDALSMHLEEVFNELRDQRSKFIAEKIFKALTDAGSDNRGTRRLARLGELCTLSGAREDEVVRVIDAFREPGRAFLMPPNHVRLEPGSVIDISHESIMRVWKRLRQWVDEENNSAQLYLRLSQSAELYQQGKTGLWVNPELQLALQWKENTQPNETWALRYNPAFERAMTFLEYSRKENELAIERKEKQQKRNLRQARLFAIILGAASVVSILFLIISLNLRFKAEASRKEALEKQKLALAESRRTEEQRSEAILQKRISDQQQQIAEQQKILTEQQREYAVVQQGIAEEQTRRAVVERKKADTARELAMQARDEAEDQRKEAINQKIIANQQKEKAEESEKNTRRLRMLSVARSMAVQANQINATMKQDDLPALLALEAYKINLVNGGALNEPDIYTALSSISEDAVTLRGHDDAVRDIALSPDGKFLASAGDDGRLLVWNMGNLKASPVQAFTGKAAREKFRAADFTADGSTLAGGTFGGRIFLWNAHDLNAAPRILKAHTSGINAIAGCPGGGSFVSCGSDGLVLLWNQGNSGPVKQIVDSVPGRVNDISVSPDGKILAWVTAGGEVRISALSLRKDGKNSLFSASAPRMLMKCPDALYCVSFNADGSMMAAGDSKGNIRLWKTAEMQSAPELILGRHSTGVSTLAFRPGGSQLASGGYDGLVKFISSDSRGERTVTAGKNDLWVYRVIYSNDGKKLISCSADRTIRIFSSGCDAMAAALSSRPKRNLSPEEWNKYAGADIPYEKTVPTLP
jgi:hypothetical protein